jgi:hypothetical protein
VGFNEAVVSQFFNLQCKQINKHKVGPIKLYNVDETGLTSVTTSQSEVSYLHGERQVGCLKSAEREQLTTAGVHYVSPPNITRAEVEKQTH